MRITKGFKNGTVAEDKVRYREDWIVLFCLSWEIKQQFKRLMVQQRERRRARAPTALMDIKILNKMPTN